MMALINSRCSVQKVFRSSRLALKARRFSSKAELSDKRMLKYSTFAGFAGAAIGGMKLLHDELGGFEGMGRTLSFYSLAIPKYIVYRYHLAVDSDDETWDSLHVETSRLGLEKILELGGFHIKAGQSCAANIGDAFPRVWVDTMQILTDQCPSKPFSSIKHIIESEYHKPLEKVFKTFEVEPIGAASIGQVHRATLTDGTPVVVKIMYPDVERVFRGDVRTIKMFAKVAQPVHVQPLEEIEKQFMTEFDYVKEAQQMATVRENLNRAGLSGDPSKLCAVPVPFLHLCTKRILVMEELQGDKFVTCLEEDLERHAKRLGKSVSQFKEEQEQETLELRKKGLSKQGPSAEQYDKYIRILDIRRKLSNIMAITYNVSIGWLPGMKRKQYVGKNTLPLNHAKIIDDLIYIHGYEVLVDGLFQGDPHPV